MLRISQTHVLPGLAAIVRPVYAITKRDMTSANVFTGAGPDYIRVARIRGQTADGIAGLIVENGCPGCTGVNGFPDTA